MRKLTLAVAVLFTLAGCGGTDGTGGAGGGSGGGFGGGGGVKLQPGGSCSAVGFGDGQCYSSSIALYCESGVANPYGCKGPMGCQTSGGVYFCDFSGSAAGDPCPRRNEGQALCSTDAGNGLQCLDGGFKITRCNGGCYVDGGLVFCRP